KFVANNKQRKVQVLPRPRAAFRRRYWCESRIGYFEFRIRANMSGTVNYEEVKAAVSDPTVLIIDVRGPEEVQSTGKIGNSINIPVADVAEALKDGESFREKYGRAIPSHEDAIIFHCLKGGRAQKASDAALALGFKNSKYYPGSYSEWSSKN
ncbi:unnamed protein product, partial [Phyllotreta striolata]